MIGSQGFHFTKPFNPHKGRKLTCKCEFVSGIKDKTKIEGYDHKAIKKQWETARDIREELGIDQFQMSELFKQLGVTSLDGVDAKAFVESYKAAATAAGEAATIANVAKLMSVSSNAELTADDMMLKSLKDAYERRRIADGLNLTPIAELEKDGLSGNVFKSDIGKLSYADEIVKQFSSLSSRFKTGVTTVRLPADFSEVQRQGLGFTVHHPEMGSSEIVLKPFAKEKLIERINTGVENGAFFYLDEKDYPKYLITHEFGHTLMSVTSKTKNFVGIDEKKLKGAQKKIKTLFSECKSEVEALQKEIDAIDAKIQNTTDIEEMLSYMGKADSLGEKMRSVKISEYSLFSEEEFFAEAFAQSELGTDDNKYTKQVRAIIDDLFAV